MKIELKLSTMTCGHCVKTVTTTVGRVDPSARVTIDLPSHQVVIESDRPAAEFVKALAEEGYPSA